MAVQNNHKHHNVDLISPPNPPAELVSPEQIDEIIQYCQGLITYHNRKIELAKQQLSQARNLKVFLEKFNQQVAINNDSDEIDNIDDNFSVSFESKQDRVVPAEERVRFSRMPFSEKALHSYFKKGSNPKTMDLIEEVLRQKYPSEIKARDICEELYDLSHLSKQEEKRVVASIGDLLSKGLKGKGKNRKPWQRISYGTYRYCPEMDNDKN